LEANLTQVVIDDRLINKARSLIEGVSDEEITATLEGWIVGKGNQIDLEQFRGKLHWDPEFARLEQTDKRHDCSWSPSPQRAKKSCRKIL
jgi:hypothetical protein